MLWKLPPNELQVYSTWPSPIPARPTCSIQTCIWREHVSSVFHLFDSRSLTSFARSLTFSLLPRASRVSRSRRVPFTAFITLTILSVLINFRLRGLDEILSSRQFNSLWSDNKSIISYAIAWVNVEHINLNFQTFFSIFLIFLRIDNMKVSENLISSVISRAIKSTSSCFMVSARH